MKKFNMIFGVFMAAIILWVSACDDSSGNSGGMSDGGIEGGDISNTMTISSVTCNIGEAAIQYKNDRRYVKIVSEDSSMSVTFGIHGLGDPDQVQNQIPAGTWDTIDGTYLTVVAVNHDGSSVNYYSFDDFTGSFTIGGIPGSIVTISGDFELISETIRDDSISVRYSGIYTWEVYPY